MSEPANNLDARVALLHKLPDAVRIRTALVGNELFISEDMRGNPALVSLVVDMTRLGVSGVNFVLPGDFDANTPAMLRALVSVIRTYSLNTVSYSITLLNICEKIDFTRTNYIIRGNFL